MTHRGLFQPLPFCDTSSYYPSNSWSYMVITIQDPSPPRSRAGQCCFYLTWVPQLLLHPLPTSRPASWEVPMINQPHPSSAINHKSPVPAGTVPKTLPNQPARLCSTLRSARGSHCFSSGEKRGGKRWDHGKAVEEVQSYS